MRRTIKHAVIPLAGLGTRMLPVTRAVPKFLLPIYNRPVLAHIVSEARQAGIEEFIFVISPGQDSLVTSYFTSNDALKTHLLASGKADVWQACEIDILPASSLHFATQPQPLGLGHAIWCARHLISDVAFAVLLPDVLIRAVPSCLAQMITAYAETGGNMVAIDEVPPEQTSLYGLVRPAADADLSKDLLPMSGMVEKPLSDPPSCLKLTGRYLLQPRIFDCLARQDKGAGGEIQLTDAMARLLCSQPFHALRYAGQDYDCGSLAGYCEAVLAYGLSDPVHGPALREALKKHLETA